MTRSVDLNSDVGENFGVYRLGHDEEIFKHISSANIACGFHAGDPQVMRKTVDLAVHHGVAIGAHPGLQDLVGFGRRKIVTTPQEVYNLTVYQVGALLGFVLARHARLNHVKPHGALYHMLEEDKALAVAFVDAVRAIDARLLVVGLAGGRVGQVAAERGVGFAGEAFADRRYTQEGQLTPRTAPNAVLTDEEEVCSQALRLVTGSRADTLCVHGDTAGAAAFVAVLRQRLQAAGVIIKPCEPRHV